MRRTTYLLYSMWRLRAKRGMTPTTWPETNREKHRVRILQDVRTHGGWFTLEDEVERRSVSTIERKRQSERVRERRESPPRVSLSTTLLICEFFLASPRRKGPRRDAAKAQDTRKVGSFGKFRPAERCGRAPLRFPQFPRDRTFHITESLAG